MDAASGMGGMAFNVAMFALVGVAVYYFYKWLSGDGETSDVVVFTSPVAGLPGKSDNPKVYNSEGIQEMPGLYEGGEFSVSTWVYIADWTINKGYNKPFLMISGGKANGFSTIVMYLGQNSSKLGVRVSSENALLTTAEINKIRPISGSSFGGYPYTDSDTDFKPCDIENIDLQRWVNITAILNGRTLDVYIDGKMSRSCVLPSMYKVSGSSLTVSLGGPYGFGGLIGQTAVADFAYSPDRVYQIYQNGPNDTSLWSKIKGYLDPGQYSFSVQTNGQNVVSAST